jgi:outer membrane lipoprotein carrier protein
MEAAGIVSPPEHNGDRSVLAPPPDGDHVWVYDPDLEQVQVRIQSHEEQQSPLAVLIDPTELDRQFNLAGDADADGLQWIVLTPKKSEDAQFAAARLGFSGQSLQRMQLRDALGQRTEMTFSHWQRNPVFAAGTFAFTPPEGSTWWVRWQRAPRFTR